MGRLGQQMESEMQEQPAVLSRLAERAPEMARALRSAVASPVAACWFLARGSSDNAALLGRYLAELVGGRPAGMAAPSLHTRYGARADYGGHVVVALSQSGETPEILSGALAMARLGAVVVAVTNEPASPLASAAHVVLGTDAGPEVAVPATKTVTAQMLLMQVVAAGIASRPESEALAAGGALAAVAGSVEAVLADAGPPSALAERFSSAERLYLAGRGLLYPAALEAALKVKETAGILAEGISTADLLHGPISSVARGVPVLALGPDRHTGADLDELARRLAGAPGGFAVLSPGPGGDPLSDAITATVRGQQLALELARRRGLDPDRPAWLSKVTPTT